MTIKVQSDYLTAKANSVCDVTCFMFEHSMLKSKNEKKRRTEESFTVMLL